MSRPIVGARLACASLLVVVGVGCGADDGAGPGGPVDRLLIVSLPGVAWRDVDADTMPNLDRLAETAAIGDVSTRLGRRPAEPVSAYLTIGAGTRAVPPGIDEGVAVDAGEAYGRIDAGDLLLRRLGFVPEGIAYLALGAARDANEGSAYGAEVGLLGDALDAAGVDRAVIANADEVEGIENDPPEEGAYRREAATALMGSDGRVPTGAVSRDLLRADPRAPFGRRMDIGKVVEAFEQAWPTDPGARVVALLEASDLTRAASYAGRATADQRRAMREAALRDADELLGEVMRVVDTDRDAVLVLSPVSASGEPQLGVAALRAPGVAPGLLRSATTRRDGYVQLADVTSTVLSLLGLPEADKVEGREFRVSTDVGSPRRSSLVAAADAAGFRDRMVPPVTVAFIAVLALLVATTAAGRRAPRSARSMARVGGWGVLGAAAGTYLVGIPDPAITSAGPFLAWVLVPGVAVAALAWFADRARPGSGSIVALAAVPLVIAVDVLIGAPLQVNTIFGYSVAVAGRFAGLGNLAFALFGSAVVLLAAVLADRYGETGRRAGLVVLAVALLIEGLPMLGADVGGILSMVPAFGVTAWLLAGRRLSWSTLLGLLAAAGATVIAFAFVDLARPEGSRTHLSRLAEHVLDGRWTTFASSLTRRWEASFGGTESAAWATIGIVAAAVVVYVGLVAFGHVGPSARRRTHHRPTVAAAAGLGTLALLGLVANDSSFAVPATMLIITAPVAIDQVWRAEGRTVPGSAT